MMKCKSCKSEDWSIVWASVLIEEGHRIDMVQCNNCKRVVMVSQSYFDDSTVEAQSQMYSWEKQKPRSFYDDYENDCIEIWDAIEALQTKIETLEKDNARLKAVVKQLMLANDITMTKGASV